MCSRFKVPWKAEGGGLAAQGREGPARSFPGAHHPPGRRWGARSPWVPSPDPAPWEGDVIWPVLPVAEVGGVLSLWCGSDALCPLSGPSDAGPGHLRLFSFLGRSGNGKETRRCLFTLRAVWTLGPGACRGLHASDVCGSGMGTRPLTWGCGSPLRLVPSGGLGGGGGSREGNVTERELLFVLFCRT